MPRLNTKVLSEKPLSIVKASQNIASKTKSASIIHKYVFFLARYQSKRFCVNIEII